MKRDKHLDVLEKELRLELNRPRTLNDSPTRDIKAIILTWKLALLKGYLWFKKNLKS